MSRKNDIFTIRAIGKCSFWYFHQDANVSWWNSLDLWAYFWNHIFDEKFLEKYKDNTRSIDIFINKLGTARTFASRITEEEITSLELLFIYNIFTEILSWLNSILMDWNIHLVKWVTHKSNGYNCEKINLGIIWLPDGENFLKNLIYEKLDESDFSWISTVVFDIFWPGEIAQGILVATYLKQKYPKIGFILNFENANEQFDFEAYVKKDVNKNYLYFREIDYINAFKGNLRHLLGEGNLSNLFINNEDRFFITKSTTENVSVKESFLEELRNTKLNVKKIFGMRYVNLRMYPFKCYYNACYFCTINHGNDYTFPHNNIALVKEYVDSIIEFIKKERVIYINFIDEAIHPEILEYFVDSILSEWLKIVYRFRARFDKKFQNEDFIKKLAVSGARYCGIWLESWSPRMNILFNKGDIGISLQDKLDIIKKFDLYDIPFHNYSIMGFPWEEREESFMTLKFLCNNIDKLDYYTCTPNIYWLMKWSYIYNNPEKFNIEILEEGELIEDFLYMWKKRDFNFLFKLLNEVNKRQFTRYLEHISPRDFWEFIDRTGIFYHFKVLYRKNPYLYPFRMKEKIVSLDKDTIYKMKFKITKFFIIFSDWLNNTYTIYSFITFQYLLINIEEKVFINWYNEKKSIIENINWKNIGDHFIKFLLNNFILSNYEEDFRSIYN